MSTGLAGAVSGVLATLPMTLAMNCMHKYLPEEQQYSLPPQELAEQLVRTTNLGWVLSKPDVERLVPVAHYGYGTVMGIVYAAMQPQRHRHPLRKGMVFGMAVWAGSYLGCRPLFKSLRPALRQPPERHLLMIAAHLVWGGALGLLYAQLERSAA